MTETADGALKYLHNNSIMLLLTENGLKIGII